MDQNAILRNSDSNRTRNRVIFDLVSRYALWPDEPATWIHGRLRYVPPHVTSISNYLWPSLIWWTNPYFPLTTLFLKNNVIIGAAETEWIQADVLARDKSRKRRRRTYRLLVYGAKCAARFRRPSARRRWRRVARKYRARFSRRRRAADRTRPWQVQIAAGMARWRS